MSPDCIITDAGPLSYHFHGGILHILPTLFAGRLYVSSSTHDEVAEDRQIASAVLNGVEKWLLPVVPNPSELQYAAQLLSNHGLDAGEAESLAIAYHRQWILLCDEMAGRKVADGIGVKALGTVGVLFKAVSSGLLSPEQADEAIARMRRARQRLPAGTYEELIMPILQDAARDQWIKAL